MTFSIQSSPASAPTINAWAFHPTGSQGTAVTGIFYAHVTVDLTPEPASVLPAGSIQHLIAEREQDPRKAAALARARQRLATHLAGGGGSLAQLRLSKGLSQAQLATAMNVKQPYIARVERGDDDLKLSTIEGLAKALGESVSTIAQALTASRAAREVI